MQARFDTLDVSLKLIASLRPRAHDPKRASYTHTGMPWGLARQTLPRTPQFLGVRRPVCHGRGSYEAEWDKQGPRVIVTWRQRCS
jgi:hypothetical protein